MSAPLTRLIHAPAPTPQDLGATLARWDSVRQAQFLAAYGEQLKVAYGGTVLLKFQALADAINAEEARLKTSYGSDFLRTLVERLSMGKTAP